MSPFTVPLARLTTVSLMFVLPLMALPAQGAQAHIPPGGSMIASGHSNAKAHQHGAGGRAHARRPGLLAHATTTYTINPSISLTPGAGPGGSSITVSGRGFVPHGTITLSVDGRSVATSCTADATGSFSSCAFTIPPETGGTHTVTASDHIADSASAIYTASTFAGATNPAPPASRTSSGQATNTGNNPSISLSSSTGKVGSNIAVSGSGFVAYATITLAFDGSSAATDCKAKANGSFRYCVLTVPAATAGTHTVTASDRNANSASAMYTVNPAISLIPSTGPAGSGAAVSGSGFSAYVPITVTVDGSSVATDCTTDATGTFRYCAFTVPAVPAGPHTVTASDSSTNVAAVRFFHSAAASFTVTPDLSLNPAAGPVGSTVTLSGSNFKASSSLAVTFDGAPLSTSGTCTADGSGNLPATNNCAFTVPTETAGRYTVTASEGTNTGTATFTVSPAISLTSSAGAVGSGVAVSGSGFASFGTITVTVDGSSVATDCTTDATGTFRYCAFTVPAATAGTYTVTATDTSANAASASYTVTPAISLTPGAGVVGSSVAVSGSGFKANGGITVTFDGSSVATDCTADASGSFSPCAFTVPQATEGPHTVTASDGTNSAWVLYTVTPTISLNAIAGTVGSMVTLSGSSFKASSSLTLTFDGAPLSTSGTCTADESGNLPTTNNCAFTIPAATGGPHTVTVSDGTNTGTAPFTVNAALVLTPNAGPVGSSAAVSGSGFAPNSIITVTFDGSSVPATALGGASCTADATGSFSYCTLIVPAVAVGDHTVGATDGSVDFASATFTI